jgi:hypothetical protein
MAKAKTKRVKRWCDVERPFILNYDIDFDKYVRCPKCNKRLKLAPIKDYGVVEFAQLPRHKTNNREEES